MERTFSFSEDTLTPNETLAVESKQDDIIASLSSVVTSLGKKAIRIDDAAGSITYVGFAIPGSSESSAVWQIMKIDESTDPELIITWADGNDKYDNIWNNHATTIVYS